MRRRSLRSMRAAALVASLAASLVALGGCYSFTAQMPGVLDLRSDGSGAALNTEKLPPGETSREGFGGIFTGDGVKATGADVTIEDRHWWVIGLFNLINTSSKEEMSAALGKNAMRNVKVGEQMTMIDAAITAAPPVLSALLSWTGVGGLISLASIMTPPMTFKASGQRILVSGTGGTAPPVEPAPAPAPTTEPAPATPAPPAAGGAQ